MSDFKCHDPDLADNYCTCGRYISSRHYDDGTTFGVWKLTDQDGNEECDA